MGTPMRSGNINETMRLTLAALVGIVFGFSLGVSFPTVSLVKYTGFPTKSIWDAWASLKGNKSMLHAHHNISDTKIWVATNPRGAERLPPGIIKPQSDFFLRRLWGQPSEDLIVKPKYLVTFTVGYNQRYNINAAVQKFSSNFTIVLFHYDGRASEWDEFEWAKRAVHISAIKQTKWYLKMVKKHNLEISQPGLDPISSFTWQMTKKKDEGEVHKMVDDGGWWQCSDPHLPPCAGFVEIMAPVFSSDAWRCVWHMIQNDLIHGWGLDFALRRCVKIPHENIGVVDTQWIVHQSVPSLGNQGHAEDGRAPWEGVRERCHKEWTLFQDRMANAERDYFQAMGIIPRNTTGS
ncbi:hypothetical protein AAHE18_06G194400 [Arachis hypogaea]